MSEEAAARSAQPVLVYEGVSKSFRSSGVTALDRVDLEVVEGEFLAIVGPSGCGKSTLLNMAAGTLVPSTGRVRYKGEIVDGPNTNVGYLTQHDTLLNWRTVHKNVRLPLEFRKMDKAKAKEKVQEVLQTVGLPKMSHVYPTQLSGGMRQRVAIARTLVYEPSVYLLDEPFGALDAQLRLIMQQELMRIRKVTGGTFVLVTHDLNEAVALANRVVVVSAQPGRIKKIFDIDLPRQEDDEVVAMASTPAFRNYVEELWALMDKPPSFEAVPRG
jgi:NitT/TauT family transport system ATP-binding protein